MPIPKKSELSKQDIAALILASVTGAAAALMVYLVASRFLYPKVCSGVVKAKEWMSPDQKALFPQSAVKFTDRVCRASQEQNEI